MPTNQTIIRKKGKYKDGRSRYVIEWVKDHKKYSKAVPTPEKLLDILDTQERLGVYKEEADTYN